MNKEIQISPRQIARAIENLLDEKIKLQQRIEKAIKYIEENKIGYSGLQNEDLEIFLVEEEINKLLEILKGEDNDR
jgi:hypothetical protein